VTEHRPFIDAIIAAPADDLPRLVYADFLEERGQVPAAEFIRWQCAMFARTLPLSWVSPVIESLLGRQPHECRRMVDMTGSRIYAGEVHNFRWAEYTRGFVSEVRCALAGWMTHGPQIVREQPVERVIISDRESLQINGSWYWYNVHELGGLSSHPPSDLPPELCWWRPGSYRTPSYATAELANTALSDALIRWAKGQPVSPPEPPPERSRNSPVP